MVGGSLVSLNFPGHPWPSVILVGTFLHLFLLNQRLPVEEQVAGLLLSQESRGAETVSSL